MGVPDDRVGTELEYFHVGGGIEKFGGIFSFCPGGGVRSAGTACRCFSEAGSVLKFQLKRGVV